MLPPNSSQLNLDAIHLATVAIPGPIGHKRWGTLAQQAERTLHLIQAEMQACHDSRSERWRESERAEEFLERLEALADLKEQIAEWVTDD